MTDQKASIQSISIGIGHQKMCVILVEFFSFCFRKIQMMPFPTQMMFSYPQQVQETKWTK